MKKEQYNNLEMVKDPFGILRSAHEVLEGATHVFLNQEKIKELAESIERRLVQKQLLTAEQFGIIDRTENGVQLVFLEDTVNFSFWPDKGASKWRVKNLKGEVVDGWRALTSCFVRTLKRGVPILDTNFLLNSSASFWQEFFQGEDDTQIPLLEKRVQNLKEAASVLKTSYTGQFKNAIEQSEFDAIKLVRLLVDNFPSFYDIANYRGNDVPFLKRAQILVYDLTLMFEKKSWGNLKNIDELTAFADYKLPQLLRAFGVLQYSNSLAEKVDNYIQIPSGSEEEIEIRAGTIWTVELLRREIGRGVFAAEIDNVLWNLSQNTDFTSKPYHRARTIFY